MGGGGQGLELPRQVGGIPGSLSFPLLAHLFFLISVRSTFGFLHVSLTDNYFTEIFSSGGSWELFHLSSPD